MVGFSAEVFEPFLNSDTDGAATAPQTDQEVGLKAGLINIGGELKGISQKIVGVDKSFRSLLLFRARAALESCFGIIAPKVLIQRTTMDKTVLSAQDLLEDSIELGIQVLESGFQPTMIIAIWRGGTPVGMALQETLSYCGVESDHIAIRTSSYTGVDERGHVAVHGLNYIVKKICHDDRVLIVDDVFDTGNTIVAVVNELRRRARDNTPEDIRVAVPWFKPSRNETDMTPDYYMRETAEWLVFPHELDALTAEELRQRRPEIASIVQRVKPKTKSA